MYPGNFLYIVFYMFCFLTTLNPVHLLFDNILPKKIEKLARLLAPASHLSTIFAAIFPNA